MVVKGGDRPMIVCASCGAGLRDDSRFCDRCGTMVPPSAQYQPYYYGPFYQIPADPQLIKEVVNTLALYLTRIDLKTMKEVLTAVSELLALGEGAWRARQYLRKWVDDWKQKRASETEP
jgi:hypothetical protein